MRDFLGPTQLTLQANQGLHGTEFLTVPPAKAVGWELDRQELRTWDSLQPGKCPSRAQSSWKGKVCPSTSYSVADPTSKWENLQNNPARYKIPLLVRFHRRKKENPKGAILNLFQLCQVTLDLQVLAH